MICPSCQQELRDNSSFCTNCGAPIQAIAEVQTVMTEQNGVVDASDLPVVASHVPASATGSMDGDKPEPNDVYQALDSAPEELPPALSKPLPEGKPFGSRAGAYVIDSLIYNVIILGGTLFLGALTALVLGLTGRTLLAASTPSAVSLGTITYSLALGGLYFAVYEWLFGASPGKVILRMRVIQEDGRRPGLWAALLRGAFRYFDGLVFGAPAVIAMNRDVRRQRYGDRYARTMVVNQSDPVVQYRRSWLWFLLATLLTCLVLVLGTAPMLARSLRIAPPLTTMAAADLNIQPEDLGTAFTLVAEAGREAFQGTLNDANVRLFHSQTANVQAQVTTFSFHPADTIEELMAAFQQQLRLEDPTLVLSFDPVRTIPVGERAGVAHFTNPDTGEEGYLLFSIQRNVITRLFSYGLPGAMSEDELMRLAQIVDARIR